MIALPLILRLLACVPLCMRSSLVGEDAADRAEWFLYRAQDARCDVDVITIVAVVVITAAAVIVTPVFGAALLITRSLRGILSRRCSNAVTASLE